MSRRTGRRTQPTLTDLPVELLEQVTGHLTTTRNLAALASTSRDLRAHAQPRVTARVPEGGPELARRFQDVQTGIRWVLSARPDRTVGGRRIPGTAPSVMFEGATRLPQYTEYIFTDYGSRLIISTLVKLSDQGLVSVDVSVYSKNHALKARFQGRFDVRTGGRLVATEMSRRGSPVDLRPLSYAKGWLHGYRVPGLP